MSYITLNQVDDTSVTFNVSQIEWVKDQPEFLRRCLLSSGGVVFNIKESYLELAGQLKGLTNYGQT